MLDWQRDLAFTFGIARALLPLGDQVGTLRWISTTWFVVIPATAFVVAAIAGTIGGLIGALLAAAYNRSPRHASVIVELPDEPELPTRAGAGADARSGHRRGGTRRGREGGPVGSPRTRRRAGR